MRMGYLIYKYLLSRNIYFDVIHAHKVSYEGVIAYYLSEKTKKPYLLTIRGDTDIKVFKYKYLSRHVYEKVIGKSNFVCCVAPWVTRKISKYLYIDNNISFIPNITYVKDIMLSKRSLSTSKYFIVVLNFYNNKHRLKNLYRIVESFKAFLCQIPDVSLYIIGDGPQRKKVEFKIRALKDNSRIYFLGHKSKEELPNLLNGSLGLVLPSLRETFGLVYIESLLSGTPVIHSKGNGIDGIFDKRYIISVNPKSINEIKESMKYLYANSGELKDNIKKDIECGDFEFLKTENIIEKYSNALKKYCLQT